MYQERVLLANGRILELFVASPGDYRIALSKDGTVLVQYLPGARILRGRRLPYEFKSVEKLRYDFEQDLQGA